jgi:tRNA pseudouridine13 synthase
MDAGSLAVALAPPRAHGEPLGQGALRSSPEDFIVEEILGFEPAGQGPHVLLKVEKRDANTTWVAAELARACGCRPRDVGFAGLKDRHAVAVQWLSVPQSRLTPKDWLTVAGQGFRVLEASAHNRKLPRGALAGNRFIIRIRGSGMDLRALERRLQTLSRHGVPNYFGPQRFGRDGGNLKALGDARPLKGMQRGFVLSAARSLVFNAVLAGRVRAGSWNQLAAGDIANLDGRGSIFPVDALDETLRERCERLDIHPTGPLWGRGAPAAGGAVQALETQTALSFPQACARVEGAGMEQERRALRLAVRDLSCTHEPDAVRLSFRLSRGSFATTVLREIIDVAGAGDEPEDGGGG